MTIGLPCFASELDFPASLNDDGDLFLDRARVTTLTNALLAWFTPNNLKLMHERHRGICTGLVDAAEYASRVAGTLGEGPALKWTEDLANQSALVMTYGILSKFVPDILLRALVSAGDAEPPPFPARSAGSEVLRKMFALQQACRALGYPPSRLRHEWPNVSPETFCLVSDFCHQQQGFGPLAWDSPGYENPDYVVRLLFSAFNEVDPEQVSFQLSDRSLRQVTKSANFPEVVVVLRRVLGFWLDFLEKETWYVRRAFYVGMVPLLRRVAKGFRRTTPPLEVADLLFVDIDELAAGMFDPATIHARRERYFRNTEYLSLQGVDAGRLATMLQNQ